MMLGILRMRRMQQQLVDVEQPAATTSDDSLDQLGELRMVFFFDKGDSCHVSSCRLMPDQMSNIQSGGGKTSHMA